MSNYRYTVSLDPEMGEVIDRLSAKSGIPAGRVIKNLLRFTQSDAHTFSLWFERLEEDSEQYKRGMHTLRNPGPSRLIADAAAIERDCGHKLLIGPSASSHDSECEGVCVVPLDLIGGEK